MKVLRTPDESFADLPDFPFGPHYVESDLIPTAKDQPEITIENAGHFLQEDKGEEVAGYILEFIERTPLP